MVEGSVQANGLPHMNRAFSAPHPLGAVFPWFRPGLV
jgi:hypothetical protein